MLLANRMQALRGPWLQKRTAVVVVPLAIAFFALVWGLPLVITPLSTDEAYYALGGRTILDGGKLYIDLWDIKPPLIYLIYAIPLAIAGDSTESIRVFDLLSSVLTVAAVFLLARRFFGHRAGLIAAGLYGFSYFTLAGFVALGEAESFMVAPVALAFALYRTNDDDRGAWPLAFASGLLLGVVIALKFSAILLVLGLPISELLIGRQGNWSWAGAIKRLCWAALGFLLVQAAWVGYLFTIDAWDAFVDIQRHYTVPYFRFRYSPEGIPYTRAVAEATTTWIIDAPYLTLPAWVAFFLGLGKGSRQAIYLLGILVLLCLIAIWWQGKLFHYHWIILLPFLAALAGYACDRVLELASAFGRRELILATALLVGGFVVAALPPLWRTYDSYDWLVQRLDGKLTQADIDYGYFWELGMNRQLVDYIRDNSGPDDSFYIWGFWTTPYFWEDRPLPTQYVANHGLRATWTPPEWRDELIQDLTETQPRFIVIAAGDRQPWLVGDSYASDEYFCDQFLDFRALVEKDYQPVLNNGLFVLYDRDAPEPLAFPRCATFP